MNTLIHKQGDLFTVSDIRAVLTHACNGQGVWGSGIAVEFKKRFPVGFQQYKEECDVWLSGKMKRSLMGTAIIFAKGTAREPICSALFTSTNYGKKVDKPELILSNTEQAFKDLLRQLPEGIEVHMPRINSGKFAVPWEQTEVVLNKVLESFPNHKVFVWTP